MVYISSYANCFVLFYFIYFSYQRIKIYYINDHNQKTVYLKNKSKLLNKNDQERPIIPEVLNDLGT